MSSTSSEVIDDGRVATGEERALVAVQSAIGVPQVLTAARGMSHFGEHSLGWLALAAAGGAVAKARGRSVTPWVTAGVGAFGAHAASVVVKRIVRRRRPEHPEIAVGVGTPSRLSFPSSHATSTTAAAVLLGRAAGLPAGALPAALVPPMLVSRLVLGVHYPSDVLAGAALGAAGAFLSVRGEKIVSDRLGARCAAGQGARGAGRWSLRNRPGDRR